MSDAKAASARPTPKARRAGADAGPSRPGPDRAILVIGPGKTGTTGVYASVKRGLTQAGRPVRAVFEPSGTQAVDSLFAHAAGGDVLVKTTIDSARRTVPDPLVFDRRVMTVRDPRDMLISALLFRPLTVAALRRADDAAIEQFVQALRAKQDDPASLSVRELFAIADRLGIGGVPHAAMVADLGRQRTFLQHYPCYLMHYERFVANELDELSSYLGVPVENVSAGDSSMFGHIARSQSSGEFVQWFHADDLDYFTGLFAEFLDAFGYPREVTLPEHPCIDPATGSEYVHTRSRERRASLQTVADTRAEQWQPTDIESVEELDRLRDYGMDGNANACARVAEVLRSGHLGGVDEAGALEWARRAAELGSGHGIAVLIDLLATTAGDDPARHRELRIWRAEQTARGWRTEATRGARLGEELAQARARIVALERELAGLRRSLSYRVGTELARAARDPRHQATDAARELRDMWRERRRRHGR